VAQGADQGALSRSHQVAENKTSLDLPFEKTPRLALGVFFAGAPKAVKVKRAPPPADFRKTLHNVWDLSLALESKLGADTRRIMLDFGYTPETLLNNIELLNVDPGRLDALVVSHGHFDHFGGSVGFWTSIAPR
jgi:metal-dependent hydrolase (beta-lactamase superfamily II)